MTIAWKESRDENSKRWTSHQGLTVKKVMKVERVMSDVYSEEHYAIVWNPETKKDEKKKVGSAFELYSGPFGIVTPDLLPEYKKERDLIIQQQEELQKQMDLQRIEKQRLERAIKEHNRPQKGMTMRVVKGRKVPKGTVGKVFWLNDLMNPSRAGLALSEEKDSNGKHKNVAWVNAEYLENTEPFTDPKEKEEAKVKLKKALKEAIQQAYNEDLSQKEIQTVFEYTLLDY